MTSFDCALFLILLQTCPNLSVETVSSRDPDAGEMAQTMEVRVLPPRELFRMRVSLESRNGMKTSFDFLVFLLASPSLLMTAPSARSDLLMFAPSFS